MTEPQRRRRRPAVSCSLCRKRKIRCNRETPCGNCLRARNATCVYEAWSPPPPPSPRRPLVNLAPGSVVPQQCPSPVSVAGSGSGSGSAPTIGRSTPSVSHTDHTGPPSSLELEAMKTRIAQLEEQLSRPAQITRKTSESVMYNSLLGSFQLYQDDNSGHTVAISKSVTHKGRLFGRSHWLHSLLPIRDMFETMEVHLREERSTVKPNLERCKHLARVIKIRRAPSWPSPPATELPARDVCDKLIDCYLQTMESIYRTLHIPTFMREYEEIWASNTTPNPAFLVKLKLVLAIGATSYDDTYSLRTPAVHWIYEAQTWLSEPEFKSRLTTQTLQISILLLFARQTANIGGSLVWISAGELLRTAMYMGLHKDPSRVPAGSTFACEMRRRLWNTVLEIVLQTSKDSGGPPLISIEDFDTRAPGNFDDEEIVVEGAMPRGEGEAEGTQTSVARALRGTFAARLAIVKYLNDLDSTAPYQEALRLDKELRASHKIMVRALQGRSMQTRPPAFDPGLVLANFIIATYLSALHTPFLIVAFREPMYAFSRMSLLENSLKFWPTVYPSSSLSGHGAAPPPEIWTRLTICGHRTFIFAVKQACVSMIMELRAQFQDGETLGVAPFRADLLGVLREIRTWSTECIKTGETNIKGHLVMCLMIAHTEGIKRGLTKEELSKSLLRAAEESVAECLPLLEGLLGQEPCEKMTGGQTLDGAASDGVDWGDIWMSDSPPEFGGLDPISWIINEGSTEEMSSW